MMWLFKALVVENLIHVGKVMLVPLVDRDRDDMRYERVGGLLRKLPNANTKEIASDE